MLAQYIYIIADDSINGDSLKKTKLTKIKTAAATPPHDHSPELRRLSRIKGQVEGVERMILEKRYCPEIVIQIKAIRSAMRSLEINIVEGHMLHCVKHAMQSKDSNEVQKKLAEVITLLKGQN